MCFLLLVSLTASAVITTIDGYLEHLLPGGNLLAWIIHLMLRCQHCYAALRDGLQVSTRREALMARCAARRGINDWIIFGRQIRSRFLSGRGDK